MFHFPASTPTQTMYSPAGNTTQLMLGFPIRTSSDQRFVGNSPRHNAASHVLHRLSMPRHPPYARNKTHGHTNNQGINTKTQKRKILASTIQFSHNTTPTHNQPQPRWPIQRKGPTGTTLCCPRHPTVHQHKHSFVTQPDASTNQAPCGSTTITGQPHHHPDDATMTRGCVSTRQIQNLRQSHTRRHQPHKQAHNCGRKIKAP